jgi:hypothetical protein
MKNLQVGDEVLVGPGKYECVYAFGHYAELERSRDFLRILPSQLELSKDHMVFVDQKGVIPASMIMVGDNLITGGSDGDSTTVSQLEESSQMVPLRPSSPHQE